QLPAGNKLFSDLLLNPEYCLLPKRVLEVRAEVVQAERLPSLKFTPPVSHKMTACRKIRLFGKGRSEQQIDKKADGSVTLTHFPETATPFAAGASGTCRC